MLAVRTARASDVSLGRDVALRQLESASNVSEVQVTLSQSIRHAGVLGQAAARCGHLPQVHDVVDERPYAAWWVMEWIRGMTLRQLLPEDGPLPDGSAVLELLRRIVDVCDALEELKRRRISHGQVHEAGICLSRGRRGAVLIAPDFVASLGPVAAVSVRFDPVKDVQDLAAVVYRLVTHQTTTEAAASTFNPIVRPSLDETLRDGLSGAIKSPGQLKHRLLAARRTM
jgi:hypothetical protein